MKICLVASSGGHWEELMCLDKLINNEECFFVTEKGMQAAEAKMKKIYEFPQINRKEKHFLIHFFRLFREARKILKKEKPEIVISTGALVSYPFCLLGKLYGSKVIYIESFARVYKGSFTGKLVYPYVDLFLVQWESLLRIFPKAKYMGGIF